MKTSLEEEVFTFLEKNCRVEEPVLIALSGGADSTCLFHLLLAARERRPFMLHVVHVDHGWREESRAECEALRLLAEKESCPFHACRLPPLQGNLEEESRKARLQFFGELQEKHQAQGIFVAHHLDDQAETVLKRLFEGSSLTSLRGMQPVSRYGALTIFRPLLSISKKEILSFLEEKKLSFFTDKTNFDTKFLRARMREELMPYLSRSFGKELAHHLSNLSDDAALLSSYIKERLQPVLEGGIEGPFGTFYETKGLHLFECRELIQHLSRVHDFVLSRAMRESAAELLHTGAANKSINEQISIDRGYLFIMKKNPAISWQVVANSQSGLVKNSWQDVWKGHVATRLVSSDYTIGAFDATIRLLPSKKRLDRYLTEKKVPRFVATLSPMLFLDEAVLEDFLTATPAKGEHMIEMRAFPIV